MLVVPLAKQQQQQHQQASFKRKTSLRNYYLPSPYHVDIFSFFLSLSRLLCSNKPQ
jgi:hypothetical protein